MRNAELGTRNILAEFEAACDCSAFRVPRSAFVCG